MWGDEIRKGTRNGAVRGCDCCRHAGQFHGVENAPADAVLEKVLTRVAVHRGRDDSVRRAGDRARPLEIDVATGVFGHEAERECVTALLEVIFEEPRLDGVPVSIANGGIEPQDNLVTAEPDVAQITAFEDGGERSGAHLVTFW